LFANSILRGIQAPAYWGGTHLLFNYEFGFAKRALLGTIIAALQLPSLYHYNFYFWLSVLIFIAEMGLFLSFLKRLLNTQRQDVTLTVFVFCASLAPVFLAHTIGFSEHMILVMTLAMLLVPGFYLRAVLVALLFTIGVLIHEATFLMFFPVVCFRFLADLAGGMDRYRVFVLCLLVGALTALAVVVGGTHLGQDSMQALQRVLQAKADYPLSRNAFLVLTRSLGCNLEHTVECVRDPEFLGLFFVPSLIVTLPTTTFLVYRSLSTLSRRGYGPGLRVAAAAASLSPLSLHFLGCDYNRWLTLAITTSFLVFAVATLWCPPRDVPARQDIAGAGVLNLAIAVTAVNLTSAIALFGGYQVQDFPYEGHVEEVLMMVSGKEAFPPRPAPLRDPVLHN
jgi:hypothetical protein